MTLAATCASRFSGKERDSETNLDYFEARYYSGAQGRFTSPDEFKGGIVDAFTGQDIETNTALPYADITNPQTLNKYAYVMNNPLRYTDPTGHCPMCVVEVLESPVVQEAIEKATPFIGAALGVAAGWALSQSEDVGRAILGGPVMTPTAPYNGSVAAELLSAQRNSNAQQGQGQQGTETQSAGTGRSKNDVKPAPDATGPHSVPKKDASGKTTGYTTFDEKGGAQKRVDVVGGSHGGVPTPHVHEPKPGKGPGAPLRHVRPARPGELPK
jgi:RHS repeat-associated protein